jgi:hypothetical protein
MIQTLGTALAVHGVAWKTLEPWRVVSVADDTRAHAISWPA